MVVSEGGEPLIQQPVLSHASLEVSESMIWFSPVPLQGTKTSREILHTCLITPWSV